MKSPKSLKMTAVLVVGDKIYKRELQMGHWVAPVWRLFPHRNAGERAFEAWERKSGDKSRDV